MRFLKYFSAFILSFSVLLGTAPAFAEEHAMSTIQGPGIDLKVYDHAFAGSIHDFLAWGVVDEALGTGTLIMRRDGQTFETVFKKVNGVIGGEVRHLVNDVESVTSLQLVKVDSALKQIVLSLNGQEMVVSIAAPAFENAHFLNPTYSTTYNGKTLSFTLNGSACYKYSLFLSMMMVGAYYH